MILQHWIEHEPFIAPNPNNINKNERADTHRIIFEFNFTEQNNINYISNWTRLCDTFYYSRWLSCTLPAKPSPDIAHWTDYYYYSKTTIQFWIGYPMSIYRFIVDFINPFEWYECAFIGLNKINVLNLFTRSISNGYD